MEYVEGRDLAAIIRAGGASPGLAALVLRDVCRALAYAHALRGPDGTPLRILHRDISPSNIMVGYDGAVRLLDFGIAKAFADPRDKRTVKGTLRGKFGYIAPEVIDGKDPDLRADLFSVGVVLHETLCAKRLFRGNSDLETLALVKRAEVPPPSSMNPAVSPELDAICLRALERDREKRFRDGDQFAEALDHVVHELRYGPNQLTEALVRCFGGGRVPGEWKHEDSGPRTVPEMPIVSPGLGTARAIEDAHARPTHKLSAEAVEKLARASRSPNPTPDAAASRATAAEMPSARKAEAARITGSTPAPRRTPLWPLIGGVVLGGVLTGVMMLIQRMRAPAIHPAAAADLLPRVPADAAIAPAHAPSDDNLRLPVPPGEPDGKLVFPHDDDVGRAADGKAKKAKKAD
jgi:serine/threonine protein kinase